MQRQRYEEIKGFHAGFWTTWATVEDLSWRSHSSKNWSSMFNSKGRGDSQQHWCPRDVLSPGNRRCLARNMYLFLMPNDLNLPVGMRTKIQLDCEKGKSVKLIFAATFVSLIPLMIKLLGQSISCFSLKSILPFSQSTLQWVAAWGLRISDTQEWGVVLFL